MYLIKILTSANNDSNSSPGGFLVLEHMSNRTVPVSAPLIALFPFVSEKMIIPD